MPLALVLAFTAKMGIVGLWLGFSIACIILDIGFGFIIMCPNWNRIGDEMRKKLEEGRDVPTTPMLSVRRELSANNTPLNRSQNGDKSPYNRRSNADRQSEGGNKMVRRKMNELDAMQVNAKGMEEANFNLLQNFQHNGNQPQK